MVRAQSAIGFNFNSDREDAALLPAEVAGVLEFSQANWNNWDGILSDVTEDTMQTQADIASPNAGIVTDEDGNTHADVTVAWESRNAWNTNNGVTNGDNKLMNGYLDNNAGTPQINITVGGLPSDLAAAYDVVAYIGSDGNDRTGTITDGTTTYSYSTFSQQGGDFPNQYVETTDTGAGFPQANYAVFAGRSGSEFTLTLDRGSNNSGIHGIQIVPAEGVRIPSPGGIGMIGTQTVASSVVDGSLMFGPEESGPGLAQEWYAAANPGDKAGADAIFDSQFPVVPAFRSTGGSWWAGSAGADAIPGVQAYPPEVQPPLTDNYTVRSTGEILIEQSGLYTFLDGVDDFTYLAIDTDKSGTAGDSPDEVLINDNTWTNPIRDANGGGEGWAEVTIDVAEGGEWLALEFNMGEGGGGDHGIAYWDYDTTAPFDLRLNGNIVPFADQAFFDADEAAAAVIPDTYLRATTAPLISGEVEGSIPPSPNGWQFDVNAIDGSADAFELSNPDATIFSSTMDVDGAKFFVNVLDGEVSEGDSFPILLADSFSGTPTVETPGWSYDAATGSIVFGAVTQVCGDFDMDGDVDSADRTTQTTNWTGALPPGDPNATKVFEEGDCDGDGDIDTADQNGLINNWTGAMNAGNTEEGPDANLIYNPETGEVILDASDTSSGVFISFVLGTAQNNMRTENFATSADGSAGPFIDVGTNTDNTPFQIGQTDPLNQGQGPKVNLGDIFPAGIGSVEALADYLTLAEYASELGQGGTFDLAFIPEPSSLALALIGMLGLVARRRRK